MAQVWVDIQPGVLDNFTLSGTWGATPTVVDVGGQHAIVVDELLRTAPRSLIYNLIGDVSNSDQIEVYVEVKVTAYNEAVTTDDNIVVGPLAQQSLTNATTENDELAFCSRRGAAATCVLYDRVADVFSFTSGGIVALAAVGVKHRLRMRVEAANFLGKGWVSTDAEPAAFQVTRTRPALDIGKSGVHLNAGARYEITALSFGTDGDSAPTASPTQYTWDATDLAVGVNPVGNGWTYLRESFGTASSIISTTTPLGDRAWRGRPATSTVVAAKLDAIPSTAAATEFLMLGRRSGTAGHLGGVIRMDANADPARIVAGFQNDTTRVLIENEYANHGLTINVANWYWIRGQIGEGTGPARVRVWEFGTAEPTTWVLESTVAMPAAGFSGWGGYIPTSIDVDLAWFSVGTGGAPAPYKAVTERRVIVDTDPLATRDYASITAALAAEDKDLVGLSRKLVIECRASTGVAETGLIEATTDWITSTTCSLTIEVPPAHRHSGVWDDTKYRVLSGNTGTLGAGRVVKINPSNVTVDGLQIQHTDPAAEYIICLDTRGGGCNNFLARNVLVRDTRTDATHHRIGIDLRGDNGMRAENCVAYGFRAGSGTTVYCAGFFRDNANVASDPGVFDNCTAYDCRRGFYSYGVGSVLQLRNCVAVGNTLNGDFVTGNSGAFDAGCSNNISSDTSAPGVNSLLSQVATDLFVAPATGDFNLKAGSNAINAGVDLSSLFTTDITGATRDSIFDIGAFEFGFAERRVIVDTDPLATRDYASLQAAITGEAKDLVGLNRALVIECRASSGLADIGEVDVLTDWVTSATNTLTIEVAAGHRHNGVWDDTKYRVLSGNSAGANAGRLFKVQPDNVVVDGVQVENNDTVYAAYIVAVLVSGSSCRVRNAIARDLRTDATHHRIGFSMNGASDLRVENCVAYGFRAASGTTTYCSGFYRNVAGTAVIDNCTAYDCRRGFHVYGTGVTLTLRNCAAVGNTLNGDFVTQSSGAFDAGCSNNISSDLTAPGVSSLTSQVATDLFVAPATGDFNLKAGSNAINAGADLSASFTTDITGTTRDSVFDIGAFEYVSSVARPTSDVTPDTWTASTGTDLFAMLNSETPDDLTYVTSLALGTYRLALSPAALPALAERRVTYRAKGNAGLTVRLYQGTTLIATRSHVLSPSSFTQYLMDLDTAEKAALTDGSSLFVELEATA